MIGDFDDYKPTHDTPEAELIAIFNREIERWQRAETDTQQLTLAQHLAASLHGWTLVPRDEDAWYWVAERQQAEITRLRAALEGTCRRYDPDDRLPCWCYASVPLEQNRVHEDKCLATRAALAPSEPRESHP